MSAGDEELFLYENIARTIEDSIANGTLKVGDKLDSVRMLSQKMDVSMSTVYNAYYELEGKGLIESRPRSGYYVRFVPDKELSAPSFTDHKVDVTEITNREFIDEVIQQPVTEEYLELSTAVPAPELLPLKKIKRSIQAAYRSDPTNGIRYEHHRGNPGLRRLISKLALSWERTFHEDDIVITAGCMEALSVSLRAVTKPGDTVVIESPTYYGIFQLLASMDLNVLEIPARPGAGISPERLEEALQQNQVQAVVLIPSFNNPLGSCIPDEAKRQIVEIITKHQVPLIEDDIYGEMFYGEHRPNTCKTYDKEGWVIYCSSFSKTLAPGFRIGWCIPGRFNKEVYYQKYINSLASPTLTQRAMAHFLEKGRYDLHLKRLRKELHIQCLKYSQAIKEYFPEGTRISQPKGGFVLWIELSERINAIELYRAAFEEKISIAPGQIFSTGDQFQNYIRISFGRPYSGKTDQGLKKLGDIIENQ
ncbi:PLP-dependent aminotransferase family protein [Aliifodinibius sp. S!AR15-10]|uniref:aminotransferase-like domain-containing protein n=1 Tax=Aliifodinibius sp. S!AR15-10 TaxID=2950437 RepID=UPI00285BF418|nr:PLP-dependent aminotransferase family protein [Aliifodinibius sp. S!AR15-10]MDR8391695.1 PLP-dependent aminotransferase family protein [Aliifodinibius sp. S!AR15-10]